MITKNKNEQKKTALKTKIPKHKEKEQKPSTEATY